MTLADLGRSTGFPKSTLFRILVTLQHHRCVLLAEDGRTYQLGSRLTELGTSFLEQHDLYEAAAKYMKRLVDECQETIFLGKLEEGKVVYLRRMESPKSIAVVKKLGQRVPAHCTATGVAMLAFLKDREVEAILDAHGMASYNAATITDRSAFWRRLAQVREQGFAIVDGEYESDLLCVSAPVFDHTRRPLASLTVAMLRARGDTMDRVDAVASEVSRVATEFSNALGYIDHAAVV